MKKKKTLASYYIQELSDMFSYRLLIRKPNKDIWLDRKFILGESLTIQYGVLVKDARVKMRVMRRSHHGALRIKWGHVKDENQRDFPTKYLRGRFHETIRKQK